MKKLFVNLRIQMPDVKKLETAFKKIVPSVIDPANASDPVKDPDQKPSKPLNSSADSSKRETKGNNAPDTRVDSPQVLLSLDPTHVSQQSYFSIIQKQTNALTNSLYPSQPANAPHRHNKMNAVSPQIESTRRINVIPRRQSLTKNACKNAYTALATKITPLISSFDFYVDTLIKSVSPLPPNTKPLVKSVLVIGIHGWFQTPLMQRITGTPTGTSLRFTEKMHTALKSHFTSTTAPMPSITLLPLESHGTISERCSQMLAEILERHLNKFNVDLVLVCTHSQGCVVSARIVERLIGMGVLGGDRSRSEGYGDERPVKQKVGLLCMASIAHGPFPFLKSNIVVQYVEKDAARELFEFCESESALSKIFTSNMQYLFIASLVICFNDQVVPLYSSVMSGLDMPGIHRALYVGKEEYANDFISRLVQFGLTLRNCGLDDHQLIIHLSEFVAGSLWSGTQGHSTIYEDENVYRYAIREQWLIERLVIDFTLDQPPAYVPSRCQRVLDSISHWMRKNMPNIVSRVDSWTRIEPKTTAKSRYAIPAKINPYSLPWIMSSLMSDGRIQGNHALRNELSRILQMYRDWHPSGAREKELKHRLEGIRSKL